MSNPILKCEDITVTFGALSAVHRVSFSLDPGMLYGVIGPNGAGKTTLLNALSGGQKLSGGQIFFEGENITAFAPHVRARKGIGRSFQINTVFSEMTAFENLRLAAQADRFGLQPFWRPVTGFDDLKEAAEKVLERVGLQNLRGVLAENLSHGDQRSLELGIAMMASPKLLLLDEPLAGVGHHEVDKMVELIVGLSKEHTVILIEHNMDVMMEISQNILVMNSGELLAQGTPEEIQNDPTVRAAYLGDNSDVLS